MLDFCLHVMTVTILPSSNVFPARISIVDHGRSTTHDYLYPTVNAPPCSFMNLWDSCSYNLINQVHVDVVCMCEIHVRMYMYVCMYVHVHVHVHVGHLVSKSAVCQ